MKFNIGDKVKFLNQTGGGVVSKIVSSQIVNVTDETGFDIPTLIKDLIKIEPMQGAGKLFEQDGFIKPTKIQDLPVIESVSSQNDNTVTPLRSIPESRNIEQGVYLAFVPHEQRWLITGDIDVYILNRTPHTLLASLFLQTSKEFEGIDYSAIDSESKLFLETIDRDQINFWLRGMVQGLFHYDKGIAVLNPLSSEFKIKGSRFYKEESYIEVGCIENKALLICLEKLSDITVAAKVEEKAGKEEDEAAVSQQIPKTQKAKIVNPDNILEQYFIEPNVAEVDLHIESLYENCSTLDDRSKFEIQMNYFLKCLNEAIIHRVQKVIFIHGVGSGILKNEIIKELKKYKGIHYFDASMAKYGVGATEVYFSQNIALD